MNKLKKSLLMTLMILCAFSLFAGDKDYTMSIKQFPGDTSYPRGAYFNVHGDLADNVNETLGKWGLDSIVDTTALTESFYAELIPQVFKAGNPIFVDVAYEEIRTGSFPETINGYNYIRCYFETTMNVYSSKAEGKDFDGNPQYVMDKLIYTDTREDERYFKEGKAPPVRRGSDSYLDDSSSSSSGFSMEMGVTTSEGPGSSETVLTGMKYYSQNRIMGIYGLSQYSFDYKIYSPDGLLSGLSKENKALSKETSKLFEQYYEGKIPEEEREDALATCSDNYAALIDQWVPGDKDAEMNDKTVWQFFYNKAICDTLLFRFDDAKEAAQKAMTVGFEPPLKKGESGVRMGSGGTFERLQLDDFVDRYLYGMERVDLELVKALNSDYYDTATQISNRVAAALLNYNISIALELPYYFEFYPQSGFKTVPKQMDLTITENGAPLAAAQFKKKFWPSFLFSYTHRLTAQNSREGKSTKPYDFRGTSPLSTSRSWGFPYRINFNKAKDEMKGLTDNFHSTTTLQWGLDSGLTAIHYTHENSGFLQWLMSALGIGINTSQMERITNGKEDFTMASNYYNTEFTKTTFDIANGDFLTLGPVVSMKGSRYDIKVTDTFNSSTTEVDYSFTNTDEQDNGQNVSIPALNDGETLNAEVSYTYDEYGNWTEAVVGPYTLSRVFIYE